MVTEMARHGERWGPQLQWNILLALQTLISSKMLLMLCLQILLMPMYPFQNH